jgi:hypothetical protein
MDGGAHELRISMNKLSASREARYPEISGPLWPWLVALGGVLVGVGVFLIVRSRSTKGRLAIITGPTAGTVVAIKAGRTRIGSLEDNEVTLPSSTVSRYHAEIIARGNRTRITDLGSKNGIRVNGQPVRESPLQAGDRIEIADIELVFEG